MYLWWVSILSIKHTHILDAAVAPGSSSHEGGMGKGTEQPYAWGVDEGTIWAGCYAGGCARREHLEVPLTAVWP